MPYGVQEMICRVIGAIEELFVFQYVSINVRAIDYLYVELIGVGVQQSKSTVGIHRH